MASLILGSDGGLLLGDSGGLAVDTACCCGCDCASMPDTISCDVVNGGVSTTLTLTEISPPAACECRIWEVVDHALNGTAFLLSLKFSCCQLNTPCYAWTYDACASSYVGSDCPGASWFNVHDVTGNEANGTINPPTPCGHSSDPMTFRFYW